MSSDDASKRALLLWIQACFDLPRPCVSLADLYDGGLLLSILHAIAPLHFPESPDLSEGASADASNWALRLSTLKRVVRQLQDFYKTQLGKEISNVAAIDLTSIAKQQDLEQQELVSLLELVLGAAVMCEEKAKFIQIVFSLDAESQVALKSLIEQCMSRVNPCSANDEGDDEGHMPSSGAQSVIAELQQVVTHLHAERQRLLSDATEQSKISAAQQLENASLQKRVSELERERDTNEGSDRQRSSVAAGLAESQRRELDDCKRELDLKMVEGDDLRSSLKALEQRLLASKELQARLEMENARMGDELDVLRDKGAKLSRAEQAVEKYALKLEELPSLRKENKDLLARLDEYLDKIQELEAGAKASSTLQRLVDQYKDKSVEMEREKFEAISARQMAQHDLDRLTQEAEDAVEARRFLEEELASARAELEQHLVGFEGDGKKARSSTSSFSGEGDLFAMDTMASLREKLRLSERELKALRASGVVSVGASATPSFPTTDSYEVLLQRDASVAVQELALARAELEDALRAKREREDALLSLRKHYSETQQELQRVSKLAAEGGHTNGGASKETESKLAQALNTVRLLEERLKEKETSISQLEQAKDKIETFSRTQLVSFKDKFTSALEQCKVGRVSLQAKLLAAVQRADKLEVTVRSEQRLVMSAVYELGAKIMDRNLQGGSTDSGDRNKRAANTFLGRQTIAQMKALDNQLLTSPAPSTPFR